MNLAASLPSERRRLPRLVNGGRPRLRPPPLSKEVRQHLRPSKFSAEGTFKGRVFDIPDWKSWPIQRQIAFIRTFIQSSSRDPALADLAVSILRRAGVDQRSYARQWAALLQWVRRHTYYVNERDERLQSPQFSIARGFGDCDDMIILLAALGDSIRLPWRLVISGFTRSGARRRWIEGQGPVPSGVTWTHIYGMGGWPPFRPAEWRFMEPTLNVPFGWDVLQEEGKSSLPELGSRSAVPVAGLGAVAPGGPPADVMRAGARLYEQVRRANGHAIAWVAYDGERWFVHQSGCVQTPLAYPRVWAGRPVARKMGGIAPVLAPAWSWGPEGRIVPAAFGDAAAAPTSASSPDPLRFVVTLPWRDILVATLPTVIGAWAVGRLMGERARAPTPSLGASHGRLRRAA